MSRITITDGRLTYSVRVRGGWELSATPPADNSNPVRSFLVWFREKGASMRATCPPFEREDYGIARHLLKKHGLEKLTELAVEFWHRHSDRLDEGYLHPMKLFAAKVPEILIEIE